LRRPTRKTIHKVCQRNGGIARANHQEFQGHNAAGALSLDAISGGKPSNSDPPQVWLIHAKEVEAPTNVFWEESARVLQDVTVIGDVKSKRIDRIGHTVKPYGKRHSLTHVSLLSIE
jgi:hypothetical protein